MESVEETKETKAVVQYKGMPVTVTFHDVKKLICPLATDQEIVIFLKTCQSLSLNPWADECYLIKYSDKDRAATVIAIDAYLKAGEANPQYDGLEAGIILKDTSGKLEYRESAFLLEEERAKVVGGWARVYRKDRTRPFYVAVNKRECIRYRRDGSLTEFWTEEKQPSMLRKVALKRALVEAFPSLFAGLASNVDYEALPAEVKEVLPEPKGETPEGELPPAYTKEGEPYWAKFFAKQKEKGISPEEVHNIMGVSSLKDGWLAKGRTLEEADEFIDDALRQTTKAKEAEREIKGEGFRIDMNFLKESLATLKWTEQTCKTFLVSQYKVSPEGTLTDVISRLSRDQAQAFTKEIADRLTAKAQRLI